MNMPIIIPSKNIYGTPKLNPIIDNKINKLELTANDVVIPLLEGENVFSGEIDAYGNADGKVHGFSYRHYLSGVTSLNEHNQVVSYIDFVPLYSRGIVNIDQEQENRFVNSVLTGKNEDGKYNISVSVSGILEKGTATANIDFDYLYESDDYDGDNYTLAIDFDTLKHVPTSSETVSAYVPLEKVDDYVVKVSEYSNYGATSSIKSKLQIKDRQEGVYITDGKISVDLNYLYSGYLLNKLGGIRIFTSSYGVTEVTRKELVGEYEKFTPSKATISINGEVFSIEMSENTQVFSQDDEKNSFSIGGNELMQSSNYVENGSGNPELYTGKYASDILSQYQNGKGTSEINCSIFPVNVGVTQNKFLTYGETINGITVELANRHLLLKGRATKATSILVYRPSLEAGVYRLEAPTVKGVSYRLTHGEDGVTVTVFGDKATEVMLKGYEFVEVFVDIAYWTALDNYVVGDILTKESLVIPVGSVVVPMLNVPRDHKVLDDFGNGFFLATQQEFTKTVVVSDGTFDNKEISLSFENDVYDSSSLKVEQNMVAIIDKNNANVLSASNGVPILAMVLQDSPKIGTYHLRFDFYQTGSVSSSRPNEVIVWVDGEYVATEKLTNGKSASIYIPVSTVDAQIKANFYPSVTSDGVFENYGATISNICLSREETPIKLKNNSRIHLPYERTVIAANDYTKVVKVARDSRVPIRGDDVPMFKDADGNAKSCIVVASEVYYDGSTMQKITIKEM